MNWETHLLQTSHNEVMIRQFTEISEDSEEIDLS